MDDKDNKVCKFCGSHIPQTASLCKECGKFQDWRFNLNISNTLLSLLIALISVSALALPVIMKVFHKPNSEFSFKIMECNYAGDAFPTDYIKMHSLISNYGDKPGSLGPAIFSFKLDGREIANGEIYYSDISSRVIHPNEYLSLETTGYLGCYTSKDPNFTLTDLTDSVGYINGSIDVQIVQYFYDFYGDTITIQSTKKVNKLKVNIY